ncbi:DUF6477 family protein [Cohaesibacter haloalkalitolerans]|uniref:DUF6477 family protein n=1 Tax=Cohaesibacter haloalkalitolerans TaxID=1162980 RepID=UPI000E64E388|nr:DUF6477 family protein [Cohaesibacter haloalkalitolerans]
MTRFKQQSQVDPGVLSFARGKDKTPSSPASLHKKGPAGSSSPEADCGLPAQGHPTYLRSMIRCGERDYVRQRDLPGLLHLFPSEIDRLEKGCPGIIVRKIMLALRAERRRGQSGHYRYSLMRHISLMQALGAERAVENHQ